MSSFSDNLKSMSSRLLTNYGQAISFSRKTVTDYNPSTGGVEPVSTTTFSGVCHPSMYMFNEIDGETIQLNDIKAIVYSVTEPTIDDTATIDSVNYRIMSVEKLKAQGVAIVYRLQLRV